MSDMKEACARHPLPQQPAYATIVPDRYPVVKAYTKLGIARAAVGYSYLGGARGGEIWEWVRDSWELLDRVEAGTPVDELPWRKR